MKVQLQCKNKLNYTKTTVKHQSLMKLPKTKSVLSVFDKDQLNIIAKVIITIFIDIENNGHRIPSCNQQYRKYSLAISPTINCPSHNK